jgi:hypothetical protein
MRPGRRAWARWTALCALAEGIGMTSAAGAAKASQAVVGEHASGGEAALGLALVVGGGLVEGVALGTLQAEALAERVAGFDRRRWVVITTAVAGVGWALASAPGALSGSGGGASPPEALLVAGGAGLGIVMGAVLGGAQSTVLRSRVRHPHRWILANAAAWAPAMAVIFTGASTPEQSWSVASVLGLGVLTGLVAGTLLGLVTGAFLPSLDGPSVHDRLVLATLRSPGHHAFDSSLVALRVRGPVTGREWELPVQYAADADGLVIVPGHAESKRWWRNLRRPAAVGVLHKGVWADGTGVVLKDGDDDYGAARAGYEARWPHVRLPASCPIVRITLARTPATTGHEPG